MWHSQSEALGDDRILKFTILRDDAPVAYAQVLELWRHDAEFRSFFIALLADAPFAAYRWETPPMTAANRDRDFECVLVNTPELDRAVDSTPFAEHFQNENDIVTFQNLSGDAVMVVPCPIAGDDAYGHLASFVRHAPESQVHHLWQAVGTAMQKRIGAQPVWLSTADMGVSWLHARLDSRPKYFSYAPYRTA